VPIVTIARSTWKKIATEAAGHEREGGGLLIGRRTSRGNFHVSVDIGLTHVQADESHVEYSRDEVAQARHAAYASYAPLEPVGAWHSHPWPECSLSALMTQISDDWDDPDSDVSEMQDGEIELVVSTFPTPAHKLDAGDFIIQRDLDGRTCRAEAWLRVKRGELVPCEVRVR
jgi:proteasome lid subunit RPN8/RPN11